jgi:hypothetical protein
MAKNMVELKDLNYKVSARGIEKFRGATNSPREVAQYTADMALELRNLAKAAGMKTLQGLLEVTYYEAFGLAHPAIPPEGESERLQELERAGKASEAAA